MAPLNLLGMTVAVLLLFHQVQAGPELSACAPGSRGSEGWVTGIGNCANGDVFLKSSIIEVGIHTTGSYGTSRRAPSNYQSRSYDHPYNNNIDGNAGFIADWDRNGWSTGTPAFSGDYFIPGSPVEGWVAEWTDGGSFATVNKGLVGGSAMPYTAIEVTSHGGKQSSFWVGKSGNLQISKVTQFTDTGNAATDKLYFSTSVTMKNTGSSTMTNVYYMRTVDPDQEQPTTGVYNTQNWVDSQRFVDGETPADRADGTDANRCFVAAHGRTYSQLYAGLGSINSHCRANHWGFNNNDASTSWDNTAWQSHSSTNKRDADEAINLMFKYDTIEPGATVQFNYAYVLGASDLTPAMQDLEYVTILSPTDIVSGNYVLFTAEILPAAVSGTEVSSVEFSIYADKKSGGRNWYTIETKTGLGGVFNYKTTFDSTLYNEGMGQLKAKYTLADGTTYDQQLVIEVTDGVAMCWDPDMDGVGSAPADIPSPYPFTMGADNKMQVVPCTASEASLIAEVAFFRVIVLAGEVIEQRIGSDSSSPYTIDPFNVDDLLVGLDVVLTAKVTQNDGKVVSYALPCEVTEQNYAPNDISFIQTSNIDEQVAPSGTSVVGQFSATDPNEATSLANPQFSFVDDAGGLFQLSAGGALTYSSNLDFESVFPGSAASSGTVSITVRATDGGGLFRDETFTMTINNINEPPSAVDVTTHTVNEDKTTDPSSNANVIHTFSVTDPDVGNSHSCSLAGGAPYFDVDPSSCALKLTSSLNYEEQTSHTFTLIVSDNGSPTAQNQFSITVNVADVNEAPTAIKMIAVGGSGVATCDSAGNVCTMAENEGVDSPVADLRAVDPECSTSIPCDDDDCLAAAGSCPRLSDTLAFSLASNPNNLFKIEANQLRIANNIDYEALLSGTVTIRIRATDAVGHQYSADMTMVITDVSEPPSVNSLICFVDEDVDNGQIAGTTSTGALCMVDATASGDEELEYTMVVDNTNLGDDYFTVQECSGIIFVNTENLDYESGTTSYSFQVRVTGSAEVTASVTVNLNNVNEPPVFSDVSLNVNELLGFNEATEAFIATAISTSQAAILGAVNDPDADNDDADLNFVITGGNVGNKFSISSDGTITVELPLDYEVTQEYTLTVEARDPGNLFDTATVTITVDPENEKPRFATYAGVFAEIYEPGAVSGAETNDIVGSLILASDPDGVVLSVDGSTSSPDTKDTLTYSIVSVSNGGTSGFKLGTKVVDDNLNDAQVINILVDDPSIFNYEDNTKNTFSITLRVSDGAKSDDVSLTVQIKDSNEAPALISGSSITRSIDECSSCLGQDLSQGQTAVADLFADPEGNGFTFSFTNPPTHDGGRFIINENTGVITTAFSTVDYEYTNPDGQHQFVYSYNIQVTDSLGASSSTPITITVGDVPEEPTIAAYGGSINENSGANSLVGTDNVGANMVIIVADQDIDGGDTVTVTIQSVNGATDSATLNKWTLVSTGTTNEYNLRSVDDLNFEATDSYDFTIVATDSGTSTGATAALSTTANFEVEVENVNDTPTLSAGTCNLSRKATVGTVACSIVASDDDSSSNSEGWGTISYTLTGSPSIAPAGNAADIFEIIEATGEIRLKTGSHCTMSDGTCLANSYEDDVITINVVATDISGSGLASTTTQFQITITPENDQPVCGSLVSGMDPLTIDEFVSGSWSSGATVGAVVGAGLISDPDPSGSSGLDVTITAGNSAGRFAISGNNIVTTSELLDFETSTGGQEFYELNLHVVETGISNPLSNDCYVKIAVNDKDEPTTFDDVALNVDETTVQGQPLTHNGFAVAAVQAADVDACDASGTYVIFGTEPDPSPIEIESATGVLSLKAGMELDYESVTQYTYNVRWTSAQTCPGNSNANTANAVVTLNVANIPESPVVSANTLSMNEGFVGDVGYVLATDPDFGNSINNRAEQCQDDCALKYSIVSDPSGYFAIDENNGMLSTVSAAASSDFETTASFTISVKVTDESGLGTSDTGAVLINLNDVDDCAVSDIMDDSTTGSSIFITDGGEDLYIVGSSLFPATARTANNNDGDIAISVEVQDATVGANQRKYTLSNCAACRTSACTTAVGSSSSDIVKCTTVEGVGGPFGAAVTTNAVYSTGTTTCVTAVDFSGGTSSIPVMNYKNPEITGISNADDMTTAGGTTVTITGENFGPVGTVVYATYSNADGYSYTTSACTYVTAHQQVTCVTQPGVGAGHSWTLNVAGLNSNAFGTASEYAKPNIDTVQVRDMESNAIVGSDTMRTSGGDKVDIYGTNFGNDLGGYLVQYGSDAQFTAGEQYTATGCVAVVTENNNGHTLIRCNTIAGVGADLKYFITVGGQTSVCGGDGESVCRTTSYHIPVITGVRGPGTYRASSSGGQVIYLDGEHFGPQHPQDDYSYITVTYGPTGSEYTAEACVISTSHFLMTCNTGPGTGKGHIWKVVIGGEGTVATGGRESLTYLKDPSIQVPEGGTNYAPPIVAYYEGLGTKYSQIGTSNVYGDTRGNQQVTVLGRNFGSDLSKITSVTYKSEFGETFTAHPNTDTGGCTIAIEHTTLHCQTVEGAGDEMTWSVTVDSQDSEAPTSGYVGPILSGLAGAGVDGASTYGNEAITITGDFFGPSTAAATGSLGYTDDFLDWVKYGATEATQYTAENCVVMSHTQIECITTQGVGANLYWTVSIAGQETAGTSIVSSYAAPTLDPLNPATYPTDGGIQIEVTGTNLGTFQKPVITFGDTTLNSTDIILGGRNDLLFFYLPEGKGTNKAVQLNVGGQLTNTVMFNYEAPQILSVHSVATDTPGEVQIIILGRSFSTAPVVVMTNEQDDFSCTGCTLSCQWISHSEVHCNTNRQEGWLYVKVDDRTSSPGYEFYNGDPVVLWTGLLNGDTAVTNGGSALEILCQYCQDNVNELMVKIGSSHDEDLRVCTMVNSEFYQVSSTDDNAPAGKDSYDVLKSRIDTAAAADSRIVFNDADGEYIQRIVCTTPEGQDQNQDVIIERLNIAVNPPQVIVESLGCASSTCSVCSSAPCFSYLPPTLSGQTGGLNDVTGGGKSITFTGSNFGLTPQVMYGNYEMSITSRTHNEIVASVIAGVGKDKSVQIVVGSQTHSVNELFTFAYDPPTFTNLNAITKDETPNPNGISTTGLPGVTIEGTNFGINTIDDYPGPILFIGTERITVTSYTHTSLTFDMPPGQGANLPIEIQVKGQNSSGTEDVFSYNPPVITSATSTSGDLALVTDTVGGRVSGEQITLVGENFGVREKSWSILLMGENEGDTDIEVTDDDIHSWSHTQIIFYVPEGQGRNKALVLTVGGQVAAVPEGGGVQCPPDNADRVVVACFNYSPPQLWSIVEGYSGDTAGGFPITLVGKSFGINGATVLIGDPQYDQTNAHPINRYRMPPTDCEVVSQDHTEVICTAPPGWGSLLDVTLTVEGRSDSLTSADGSGKNETFSYAAPVINFVMGNKGGDASGGEEIKIYGDNFGPQATSVVMKIGNETCENAYWTNDDPLFKRNGVNIPYVKCPMSPRTTVGPKNVTLQVAFSEAETFRRWSPECKIGFYGDDDEFCADCGESAMTGYVCLEDGLTLPYAETGWWRIMQEVSEPLSAGASKCHEEMTTGTREECPTMWPCMPGFACLGNNTCEVMYDPLSERCSDCNMGYFKLNGLCAECPDKPWVIALGIVIVGGTAAYIGSKLDKKKVNLGIITIGVDYFQVLAIFSSANVDWPSELVDLYNILSAFNLNIDLAAPECWQGADFTYDQKWMVVEITPIALLGMALIAYVTKYMFKRFKGRKARLHSHAPKLFGTTVTIMYYTYLYVTTKTLSVFNCQPTVPSDGFQYMTEVGTGDGICYEDGSMQQKLEPWAYVTFALYTLGFPVFCGVLLYVNRMTCFLDQVMKAAKKNDEELKACGTYKFRKMWHRLYHYYKPQYFYWILLVLFRKFMIALTSLVFRGNTLFMLSMTLLVIIVSYALQIKYSPYMSTAEYAEIVDKNSAMMDSVTSEKLMQLKVLQQQSNRSKAAKLGRESLINLKPDIQLSFLHNYNTVESSLLFSAVLVNLSGIMFESNQLTGVYKKSLTYFIISLVSGSLFYFMWVLMTELWVAFYPDSPFLGLPCLNIGSDPDHEEGARIRESSMVFDSNPMANQERFGLSDEDGKKMEYLEKELNKMWANVAEKDKLIKSQQEEIRNLKKGTGASKFQGLAGNVIAMNKKKKAFGNVDKRSTKTVGSLGGSVQSLGGSGKGLNTSNPMVAMAGGGESKKEVGGEGVGDSQL
ncbi:hypothetical protein TrST_g13361 [Triparma strigata]|uniref:Cadherin domain-containing protein n=1 Tax=Triparma strigata TaxID=1606541 RepID=A0A9W7BZH5_9STRA|nr:hypothetical protein TrST_g13361 [Triparma strigata]